MRALLYSDFETLSEAELPAPAPATDEVLLRVLACGICGSELESFRRRSPRRPPPLVFGHEFCGVVERTGSAVREFSAGDRVVGNALVSCGTCPRCVRGDDHLCPDRQLFGMHRPGAFAEFVAAPARCLIPWPEGLPAEAACLAEPLANGIHVARMVASRRPKVVVVIGAGPIGLLAVRAFLAETGARVIVSDLSPTRLAVASKEGGPRVHAVPAGELAAAVEESTAGEGAEAVVDAVGTARTKRQSVELTCAGGTAIWLGLGEDAIQLSTLGITLREISILGSYGGRLSELRRAVALLAARTDGAPPWVTTAPLSGGAALFHRMLAAQDGDIKGVLLP